MTNRQRIVRTGLCDSTDRAPFFFYFGPWDETVKRWRTEGLSEDRKWDEEFGFDPGIAVVDVNLGYSPRFEERIVEDRGETVIKYDSKGILIEDRKDGCSIPRFIEYPVKDKTDWETLKRERLDPDDPSRFPPNWEELVREYADSDSALQLGCYPYGLFGTLRDMMGVEELLVSFYDRPKLIRDMMDYLTNFWLAIFEKAASRVKVDIIHIWEDMSGKHGSLISPAMIREFMLPNYKKIREFADANGIEIVSLDTDGDVDELIPLFMESGINLLLPFEVAAGADINEYRRLYPRLSIMGGINKLEIAKGKAAIDSELSRLVPVMSKPGYFPALDHLVHPEISWDDFKYFVYRLKEMIESRSAGLIDSADRETNKSPTRF
jgi:hypothetical protein